MGGMSPVHWLIVIGVIVLLFGTGKVSGLMGDVAKGIKSFKKNMAEDDASMEASATVERPAGTISPPGTPAATAVPQPVRHT